MQVSHGRISQRHSQAQNQRPPPSRRDRKDNSPSSLHPDAASSAPTNLGAPHTSISLKLPGLARGNSILASF